MSKYKITVYDRTDIEFFSHMDVIASDINKACEKVRVLGLDVASVQKYVTINIEYDYINQGILQCGKKHTLYSVINDIDEVVHKWKDAQNGTVLVTKIEVEDN